MPRVVTSDETLRRVLPLLPNVPITRVADLSPLDPGRAPVFCAVTPTARDLTTHLGKGLTPSDAKASAVMEAIERLTAEQPAGPTLCMDAAGMERAGHDTVPADLFDLPLSTSWSADAPFSWVEGHCIFANRSVWLPADLVLNPPREGIIEQVDTNGLASGNTRLEAILHALCEVIERDAISQVLFAELYGEPETGPDLARVDLTTLPEATCRLVEGIVQQGREVLIDVLTLDIAVPVLRATIVDPAYPTPGGPGLRMFAGYGCDPNAEIALGRAVSEAIQAMLAVVQGARDSFNEEEIPQRAKARAATSPPAPCIPFKALPSFESMDLRADLDHVKNALAAAGFTRGIVVDLTRPDLGIPVLRVRVPGLAVFAVDRNRIGARCLRWLQ